MVPTSSELRECELDCGFGPCGGTLRGYFAIDQHCETPGWDVDCQKQSDCYSNCTDESTACQKKPCQPVRESQSDGLHTVSSEPGCSTGDLLVQKDASIGQNSPAQPRPAVSRDETDESESDVEELDTSPPSEAESELPLTSDTAPT
ncbi:unnamed protein product [Leuciscus chuanchicus]